MHSMNFWKSAETPTQICLNPLNSGHAFNGFAEPVLEYEGKIVLIPSIRVMHSMTDTLTLHALGFYSLNPLNSGHAFNG